MSKVDFEASLQRPSELQSYIRTKPGWSPSEQVIVQDVEVPRSEFSKTESLYQTTSASYRAEAETILPKRGEEVISFGGKIHPIVGILLESKMPSQPYEPATSLPIVQVPTQSSILYEKDEERDISWGVSQVSKPEESGAIAPMPSPLRQPEKTSQLAPPVESNLFVGRKVLFIYPPGVDQETVRDCYKVAEGSILRQSDEITICWAGGSKHEASPGSIFPVSETNRSTFQSIRVFSDNYDEATEQLRQKSPFIHQLIATTRIKEREFEVKLEPHAGIRWLIQQELHGTQGEKGYDLVLMPCLLPSQGADLELEKFLLTNSPSPVVLLRSP